MAYANDPSGGRTGPYWRRQYGITLPGERSAAQLRILNLARARMGLPPEGGPVGDMSPPAPRGANAGGNPRAQLMAEGALRSAHPAAPLRDQFQNPPLHQANQAADLRGQFQQDVAANPPGAPAFEGGPTFDQGLDPRSGEPTDLEQLRQKILAQYQGAIQPQYANGSGRDALRRFAQQHMQRRAMQGGAPKRPILPQRRARKALPY